MKPQYQRPLFRVLLKRMQEPRRFLQVLAGDALTAIEVKSGVRDTRLPGIAAFAGAFPVTRQLLVGAQGIPLAEFLSHPATHWFE